MPGPEAGGGELPLAAHQVNDLVRRGAVPLVGDRAAWEDLLERTAAHLDRHRRVMARLHAQLSGGSGSPVTRDAQMVGVLLDRAGLSPVAEAPGPIGGTGASGQDGAAGPVDEGPVDEGLVQLAGQLADTLAVGLADQLAGVCAAAGEHRHRAAAAVAAQRRIRFQLARAAAALGSDPVAGLLAQAAEQIV